MKAIVTITVGLILMSTTFAQSSRRSETKENNSQNSRRSETVVTERKPSTDRSNDNKSGANEKKVSDNVSADRRTEPTHSPVKTNESNNGKRSETVNNSPISGQNNGRTNDRRGPSDQRNNGYGIDNQNSNTHVYNNRGGSPDNHGRVEEHTIRTVEPRHHYVDRKSYRPVPIEVRRVKEPYRRPVRPEVVWTVELSRNFEIFYPAYRPYHYHYGMRITSIAAYDAFDYVGEIVRVYGRVVDTYYSLETDEYFLYFGDFYPYQDFSVVVPGREARDFDRKPEQFFDRQYVEVTGLVTRFEAKPEMVVKRSTQIAVY